MVNYSAAQDMVCGIGCIASVVGIVAAFLAVFCEHHAPRFCNTVRWCGGGAVVLGMVAVIGVCMSIPYEPTFIGFPPVR